MICVLLSVTIIMWSHAHLYQLQVNFSKQYTVAISFINQINFMAVSHTYTDHVLLTWAESYIWYFMYMIGQGLHAFLGAHLF